MYRFLYACVSLSLSSLSSYLSACFRTFFWIQTYASTGAPSPTMACSGYTRIRNASCSGKIGSTPPWTKMLSQRKKDRCVCVIILGCVFFSFLYHVLYVTRKTVSRLATTSPIYQLPQTVTLNQPLDCAPSLCKPRKECQLCSAAQASLCDKSEISYSNGNVYF